MAPVRHRSGDMASTGTTVEKCQQLLAEHAGNVVFVPLVVLSPPAHPVLSVERARAASYAFSNKA